MTKHLIEIDPDRLVDRNEVAHILGVGPTAVSNYVARTSDKHAPFPEPVLTRALGRFRLWDLDDVWVWHVKTFPDRKDKWDDAMVRLTKFRKDYQ